MKRIILFFLFIVISQKAYTHGGGRDENGGHIERSTGLYHCHTDDCVPVNEHVEEDVEDPPDGVDSAPVTIAGSWGTTKKWARDIVYAGENETFYCGCSYTAKGRKIL